MVEVNALNIQIPAIGTPAQDWARILNENFSIIDYHNHTLNYGLQIDSTTFAYGDVNVNNQSISHITYLSFLQTSIGGDADYLIFVNNNGDLIYSNEEFAIQITSGSGLNISDAPVGFTITGTAPRAIFDPGVFGIRFNSSVGNNTSTIIVDTLDCTSILVTGNCSITNTQINQTIIGNNLSAYFGIATFTASVPSFSGIASSYNAWETAPIYKLSENGVFYYDNLPYSTSTTYNLSYFSGSKNWISSPNTAKGTKVGSRYYMKTVSFPITSLTVNETFILDDNLNGANLVSFVPKISTTTAIAIGGSNVLLSQIPLPTFEVIFGTNSLSVAVDLDFSSYVGIFTSLTINFKIIYVNNSYTIVN